MVRDHSGKLQPVALGEAISIAAAGLKKAGKNCAGFVSSGLTNETFIRFGNLFKKVLKSDLLDTPDGNAYRAVNAGIRTFSNDGVVPEMDTDISDILTADCILVTGGDIDRTHPVAGNLIRCAVNDRHARLIVIDPDENDLPLWTTRWLQPAAGSEVTLLNGLANLIINNSRHSNSINSHILQEFYLFSSVNVSEKTGISEDILNNAATIINNSKHTVIVTSGTPGKQLDTEIVNGLLKIATLTSGGRGELLHLHFLHRGINSRGAWEHGMAMTDIRNRQPESLYLLCSGDSVDEPLIQWANRSNFLVVQASYHSPMTEIADVVLPSPVWSERFGGYSLMTGNNVQIKPIIQNTIPADIEIINRIIKNINNGR